MKLLFAVFLACALNVYAKSIVGLNDCKVSDFRTAQVNFDKKLGLPETDDWNHPLDLFKAIQDSFGLDARFSLVYACNAFNSMFDELNAKNISVKSCFDPIFLLSNADTPDYALIYAGVVGTLRFQCGPGFYPLVNNDNWKCATGGFKAYGDAMYKQLTNVLTNTQQHPTGRCQVVKDGEVQYYKPLHDACSSPEITYFACQSFNQFFNSMYGECQNECKLIA